MADFLDGNSVGNRRTFFNLEDNDDTGSNIVDETEKKYFCDDDVDSDILLSSLTGTSPCKLAYERGLEIVVLNHRFIDEVGDYIRFMSLCKQLKEIDLAWNRLTSWAEIAVLMEIPNLQVVNLSHNPLKNSIDAELPYANHLKTLIINGINLPFTTIGHFVSKMPSLYELHISDNSLLGNLLDIPDGDVISETVQIVYFNRCNITIWNSVVLIKQLFPQSHSFFLCENPITSVTFIPEFKQLDIFNGISFLNMNKCLIDNWASIESLSEVSSLRDLRLQHIPLLNNYSSNERNHLIIGRMPLLETLNGSKITVKEREESERFFLRYYDNYEIKPIVYGALLARHGHIEQLCKVDLTPKMHAYVVVICEENGYTGNVKVRLSHSVSCLMRMLEKLTNIHHARMRIFYLSGKNPFAEELRFPNQKLLSLRVEDGDKFSVQSKIVLNRRKRNTKNDKWNQDKPKENTSLKV